MHAQSQEKKPLIHPKISFYSIFPPVPNTAYFILRANENDTNTKIKNALLSVSCQFVQHLASVEDPGCLSRIPDPDVYPSRIPDPKTATKERSEKNLLSYFFL